MLTNLSTIRRSVKTLESIEKRIASGAEGLKKKELAQLEKQQIKLSRNLSGIRSMRKPPGLLVVVDTNKEHIAVAEANKLGIPVIALVDTNCDPDCVDHVIPCNDDALKSNRLIIQTLANTVTTTKNQQRMKATKSMTEEEVVAEGVATETAPEEKKESGEGEKA
jgi:small subunit ribosomal protein S2